MIPGIGKFNFPVSMLTSDVIVLNGYLLINMHICGYLLDMRFLGEKPNSKWYVPFVFISIFWAISIHTVTTFLYSGLGGRPRWNTALLAPRFLTSAFVAGPGFIIVALTIIRKVSNFHVGDGAIKILANIIPEFIPSTLHEIVEYLPCPTEWKVSAGIWAAGLLIYTLALRVAIPIFSGEVSLEDTHKDD